MTFVSDWGFINHGTEASVTESPIFVCAVSKEESKSVTLHAYIHLKILFETSSGITKLQSSLR